MDRSFAGPEQGRRTIRQIGMIMLKPGGQTAPLPVVHFAQGTLPGARAGGNDDAVLAAPLASGLLCAVADGVGSLPQGGLAARIAVQAAASALPARLAAGDSPAAALRQAVLAAHAAVREAVAGSGATTLVAAVVADGRLTVANVGDSRGYVLSRTGMVQLTSDHGWAAEQVRAGLLTAEQAATHPWRTVITRCLGGEQPPEVDIFERPLAPGDRLILCSDGLPAVVAPDEMAQAAIADDPEDTVAHLLRLAETRGARDDVTVCVVAVQASPSAAVRTAPTPERAGNAPPPAGEHVAPGRRRWRRVLLGSLAVIAPVALALAIGLAWLTAPGRVTPGVTVAGAALGGLDAGSAADAIRAAVGPQLVCPVTLTAGNQAWVRTPAELGLWLDAPATAEAAAAIGRRGDWRAQLSERLIAAYQGIAIAPVVRVDSRTVLEQVEAIAVDYEAREGARRGDRIPAPLAALMVVERLLDRDCGPVALPVTPAEAAPDGTGQE